MKNRQQSLMHNVAIVASLAVLLVIHGWFWGSWKAGSEAKRKELDLGVKARKAAVAELKGQTDAFKQTVQDTQAELDRRQKELDSLGTFLPSIKTKPEVYRQIMQQIEKLGIRISTTNFPDPAPSSGGYLTVNFSLELEGPYNAFKQLLAQLQQTDMIIRIASWNVKNYGNDATAYQWRVDVSFQTYFGVE